MPSCLAAPSRPADPPVARAPSREPSRRRRGRASDSPLGALAVALVVGASPGVRASTPPTPDASVHRVYDLVLAGKPVGTRDVTVRWRTRGEGGTRTVVEVLTQGTFAGTSVTARATGVSSRAGTSFTAAAEQGTSRWEVQAREAADGASWRQVVREALPPGARGASTARRDESVPGPTVVTTLDLHDEVRGRALCRPGPVILLVAETGERRTGVAVDPVAVDLDVAGVAVPATRCEVRMDVGTASFAFDGGGTLLRADLLLFGVPLVIAAREAPEQRSWGTLDLPLGGGSTETSISP